MPQRRLITVHVTNRGDLATTVHWRIGLPGPSSPPHRLSGDGPTSTRRVLADELGAKRGHRAKIAEG